MSGWASVCVVALLVLVGVAYGQDAEYWNNQAKDAIERAIELQKLNIGQAKNAIVFIGDGMSVPTITAARIRQGQLRGETGEENSLAWDDFPHVGMIKTYNTDAQVADSAGTATAFWCGVKTKSGVIGIDDRVDRGDCTSGQGGEVDSILTQAYQNSGKSVGFITTARITHATPAALYAHSADRNWEDDSEIPSSESECDDIAVQLVRDNTYIKVILGGGRQRFYPNTVVDVEYTDRNGLRTDNRSLVDEWLADKQNAHYVWNKTALEEVDVASTDYLLGLFEGSHMRYASESEEGNDPSLAEMTEVAINMLKKEEKGFFLAVEGARIDHAHHAGRAFDALGDTVAMSDAVAKALEMTNEEDTLIIVTSDHAHTMGMSGYPTRGNPILGLVDNADGSDDLPYTTLGYLNGPGAQIALQSYSDTGMRPNHTNVDTADRDFHQDAIVPLGSETHGGDDVVVYAHGPMAHLFHGVQEQSYIAHVVRFAGCYDDDEDNVCNMVDLDPCGSATLISRSWGLLIASFLLRYVFS